MVRVYNEKHLKKQVQCLDKLICFLIIQKVYNHNNLVCPDAFNSSNLLNSNSLKSLSKSKSK